MSPSVDPSMSLHPTAMITQQMGQLSLGNTGAVSGILGYLPSLMHTHTHSTNQMKSVLPLNSTLAAIMIMIATLCTDICELAR